MSRKDHASEYLNIQCEKDNALRYNIKCLDQYDLSEFLSEGRNIWNIRDAIEEKYDKEFKEKYGIYVFDNLDASDFCDYLMSRYTVWTQEYIDWVVRHENGAYEPARKRAEDD